MWQTNLPGRSSHQHEPTVVTTKTCMYGCLVGDYFIMICIYDMSLCDQPTGKIVSSTWTHYHLRHCLVRHRLVHRLIDFVSARSCWETWCSGPPSRLQLHDKQTHSRATIAPDGEGWRWGWRWSRGGGRNGSNDLVRSENNSMIQDEWIWGWGGEGDRSMIGTYGGNVSWYSDVG